MTQVLIVDDEPICRELLTAALAKAGYTSTTASNGREALAALSRSRPRLILLDLAMPEMDGMVLLRTMRRNLQYRDIPVILLTARADHSLVREAAQLGVSGYLLKSQFALENLLARVERILHRRRESSGAAPARAASQHTTGPSPRGGPTRQPGQPPRLPAGGAGGNPAVPAGQAESPLDDRARRQALDGIQPLITQAELMRLVTEGLKLKPLAPVVQNVMAATGSAECTVELVAKAVGQDQALSIRVMRLSNSAVYARGRPAHNIKDAVSRLGTQEVRNVVMALGVIEQYQGLVAEHIDPQMFWEHSIACGVIAATLARDRCRNNDEDFFLWGLLHDVGRLTLLEHVPDRYSSVFEIAERLQVPLEKVEGKALMLDHCSILNESLQHWRFPREFIVPVVNHHGSADHLKRLGPAHVENAAIIALADRVAHALLIGESGNPVIYPIDDLVRMLGLSSSWADQIIDHVLEETQNLKCTLMAQARTVEWPSRLQQVQAKLPAPVRPFHVTWAPAEDTYQLLLRRIGDSDSGEPNLGVITALDVRTGHRVVQQFLERESRELGYRLPVLIVINRGNLEELLPALGERAIAAFRAPVRLEVIINALRRLLDDSEVAAFAQAGLSNRDA